MGLMALFLQCSQEELAEIGLTALQFKKIMAYAPGGPKINEPAVGGSLPSSRWRFSSLAWPALAENAHT